MRCIGTELELELERAEHGLVSCYLFEADPGSLARVFAETMSRARSPHLAAVTPALWQVPKLSADARWLGGVAAAVAREIGVAHAWVRLAFVLLTAASGVGLLLYAALWAWLSHYQRQHPRREYVPEPKAATANQRLLGVVCTTLGLLLAAERSFPLRPADGTLWPVALAGFGMLLAWSSGKGGWLRRDEWVRAIGGLALVAVGVAAFVIFNIGLTVTPRALLTATAVLALLVLIVAPWLWRAASQVSEERYMRARADERSELAAHLHDSVLQTLSLIQRSAGDAEATVRLARRQERELRRWLYEREEVGPRRFRASLSNAAAEIEELCEVPVEVVIVGDVEVSTKEEALLAAARESMLNAARHSQAARVDVYAECSARGVEVFVRDTGIGFDLSKVPRDRHGVSDSIIARMQRAGGHAEVQSELGQGTEVCLFAPKESAA